MSKLFRFYIDEINRTKSPYTSEVLTDLFVVADNLEDARRIAENRLRTITAEKQKHKEYGFPGTGQHGEQSDIYGLFVRFISSI